MYETLEVSRDGRGVVHVALNRPVKHNAMSGAMIGELTDVASVLGRDASVRVVVLTGTGKSFCAGGDLRWMQDQIAAGAAQKLAEATRLAMMLRAWNELPKPVIGRINGNAFGGGVGLASVCDVAIGVDGMRMGLTETKLGLSPATIGPYVIARMGEARARRVFMSSRLFGPGEAVTLGLLAYVVKSENLDASVEDEVVPYLRCAPGAVAESKALARALGPVIDDAAIARSLQSLVARWESDEAREGIAAFFEKRDADWVV